MANSVEQLLWKTGRIFRYLQVCPKIAEPCVGIGAFHSWFKACGLKYEATNCCVDFDKDIEEFYSNLQKDGDPGLTSLRCGPVNGDIMKMELAGLDSCEIFVAGPPCQPYAANGSGKGFQDDRSAVLEACIDWIIELAHRGSLIVFLLENSEKLTTHSEFWSLLDKLICACPWFKIEVVQHDLRTLMPHSRPRVWVRGLRLDCLPSLSHELPAPLSLKELGTQRLKLDDFLEEGLPNVDPDSLTPTMQANLLVYKKLAKEALESETCSSSIFCCELDRNPLRVYGGAVAFDQVPSFRTQGPQIFIISIDDLGQPWTKQRIHRFLSVRERFALQGHPHNLAKYFSKKTASMKASGNAFNVLVLATMLSPLLEQAAKSGVIQRGSIKHLSQTQLAALVPATGPQDQPKLKTAAVPSSGEPAKKRKRICG